LKLDVDSKATNEAPIFCLRGRVIRLEMPA